jgi:hypothetical protein
MNPRANHSGARARCQLRGFLYKSSLGSVSGYNPPWKTGANLPYIKLNIPMPCPPHSTFPDNPKEFHSLFHL